MPTKVCDFKEYLSTEFVNSGEEGNPKSGRDNDKEIEEVERKISNLSEKLKAIHLEKAEMERPSGRLIPVKYMEQKVLQKQDTPVKKVEDLSLSGAKVGLNRRVSMCPTEIYSTAMKSRPSTINKPEIDANIPVLPLQSRKKSCFWNLDEIDELKVTKERRKSMASTSLSPKVGKIARKVQPQNQALTTMGPKKGGRKEESVISSIQPKRLFKDVEKEKKKERRDVLVRNRAKVVVKPGRVVASRYNQSTASAARKRSFPENEKDEAGRMKKRRNSNVASKVKKRWEIVPGDMVVYRSSEEEKETREGHEEEKAKAAETPATIVRSREGLRRLKVTRGMIGESPRDPGVAKRVSELERSDGRYFVKDEEGEAGGGFGQALSFIEDDLESRPSDS